jgi:hypothetical protein
MPESKVYAFSQHIGTLCVTHDTNVHKLGAKLGIDPAELLRMINRKVIKLIAVFLRDRVLGGQASHRSRTA